MSRAVESRLVALAAVGVASFVLLALPTSIRAVEAVPVAPGQPITYAQQREVIWHEATALVPTQLFFPAAFDAEEPHTLVVALHGYGSSAEAFGRVGRRLAADGFLVAVPQPPYAFPVEGGVGFDWTLHHLNDDALSDRATPPLIERFLPDLVRDIGARYAIDRVYALGFSQGAVMAIATSVINHDVFDGAVLFGLADFRAGWFPGNSFVEGRDVDVLLVHGRADDRVPFAVSERARDALAAAGYDVTLQPFRGGHSVPDEQLELVADWIRDRVGSSLPEMPASSRR
jgi:phospholipase/carboxylesterase